MGPGQFSPGECCDHAFFDNDLVAASMGPGQFSPGEKLLMGCTAQRRTKLQWGRGNLAPESGLMPPKIPVWDRSLQWGRGNLAPESIGKFPDPIGDVEGASMGPGQFSPGEDAAAAVNKIGAGTSFNGAGAI